MTKRPTKEDGRDLTREVAETFEDGPTYIQTLVENGPFPCNRCRISIELPGICDRCAVCIAENERNERIADALMVIPQHHRWADFRDGARLSEKCGGQEIVRAAQTHLGQLMKGEAEILVMVGDSAGGKTSLACACLRHVIQQGDARSLSSRFVFATDIAEAYRGTPYGHEPPIIGECRSAWILVIDDLSSDHSRRDLLRDVIIRREAAEKPTLITTYLGEAECADAYGGGVARRLFRDGSVIDIRHAK